MICPSLILSYFYGFLRSVNTSVFVLTILSCEVAVFHARCFIDKVYYYYYYWLPWTMYGAIKTANGM